MANCVANLLRIIWAILLGSLRFILFFGCLLLLIQQIVSIYLLLVLDDLSETIGARITLVDYLYSYALLAVALLGCYGSFFKHRFSLKAFAVLTTISASIFMLIFFSTLSSDELKKINHKISHDLEGAQKQYKWTSKAEQLNDATRIWDVIQSFSCCGLNGPEDWNAYRPSSVDKDAYPSSCCHKPTGRSLVHDHEQLCFRESSGSLFHETGCMERIVQIEAFIVTANIHFFFFQIFLCILACIVGSMDSDGRRRAAQANTARHVIVTTSSNANHMPAQYLAADYMRQPPVNESYVHHNKQDHLYPNFHDDDSLGANRVTYTAPPPSYGTQR